MSWLKNFSPRSSQRSSPLVVRKWSSIVEPEELTIHLGPVTRDFAERLMNRAIKMAEKFYDHQPEDLRAPREQLLRGLNAIAKQSDMGVIKGRADYAELVNIEENSVTPQAAWSIALITIQFARPLEIRYSSKRFHESERKNWAHWVVPLDLDNDRLLGKTARGFRTYRFDRVSHMSDFRDEKLGSEELALRVRFDPKPHQNGGQVQAVLASYLGEGRYEYPSGLASVFQEQEDRERKLILPKTINLST